MFGTYTGLQQPKFISHAGGANLGCGQAIASRNSAKSGTFLAMGPDTACTRSSPIDAASPQKFWGTRPTEGRRPTSPQNEAGMRSEPPRSEPVASHTCHHTGVLGRKDVLRPGQGGGAAGGGGGGAGGGGGRGGRAGGGRGEA